MKFGKIIKYILFGGGDLLVKVAQYLILQNYDAHIIASQRHIKDKLMFVSNSCFGEYLKENSFNYIITKNIENDVKKSFLKILSVNLLLQPGFLRKTL